MTSHRRDRTHSGTTGGQSRVIQILQSGFDAPPWFKGQTHRNCGKLRAGPLAYTCPHWA